MTNSKQKLMIAGQMVEIPAGSIAMRDDRTGRAWSQQIQPFLIGSHAVTQSHYFALTGQSPSLSNGNDKPVESVSWLDAVRFCNLLSQQAELDEVYHFGDDDAVSYDQTRSGYRLPSEAEWEYACRAGSDAVRYGPLDAIAWYDANSGKQSHDVGQKQPNGWGLFDMLGNVWEWCWDLYDGDVYGSYRVFRGGGWADPARGCLVTNRRRSHPTFAIDDLGFRVARNVDQKS